MLDLTVICGTFGDSAWAGLAQTRARPTATLQGLPFIHSHAGTLAEARNQALQAVTTEWVACLDADDELEPGYAAAMATGTADVRAPRLRQVKHGRPGDVFTPRVWRHRHDCTSDCLPEGNWLVTGAVARTALLRDIGGWWEEPIYEDWSLWLRCWKAGATFEQMQEPVYRAHVRRSSRNHAGPAWQQRDEWHRRIYDSVMGAAA